MQLAKVIGHATSTIKHPSMKGLRLVIVQPVGIDRNPEADPLLVIDKLGSAPGHTVVLNSDGKGARELVGNDKTPVRWYVIGIVDE
jgi:ethanolamine utilization protein EutN